MAWLGIWLYRKTITISRASGAVTNYPMRILIGESSGAAGEDVDCGGHVASDFDDLRFTASDGTTLLDYWIESISGTTPNQLATVWVECNSIGTTDTTFYMYYGKASATAYSNGANTFITFDDFERGSNGDAIDGSWSVYSGSAVISTDSPWGGTRCAKITGVSTELRIAIDKTLHPNVSIMLRLNPGYFTTTLRTGNGSRAYGYTVGGESSADIKYFIAGGSLQDTGVNASAGWNSLDLRNIDMVSPGALDLIHDDVKIVDGAAGGFATALSNGVVTILGAYAATYNAIYIDNFIIRNFRDVEPVISAYGAEEGFTPSTYPASLDSLPTDRSAGDQIPSTDWNIYSLAYRKLESTVGITGSTVDWSMDYKIKSSSSVNPGHRHTELFNLVGTSSVSGGSTLDRIVLAGVPYYVPSAAATTGALLYNPGTGTLGWSCKVKARMSLSAAQAIASTTEEELVLDTVDFQTIAGICNTSNGRIIPGIAGYYLVGGSAQITSLADGKNTYTSIWKGTATSSQPYVHGERHNTGAAGTNGGMAMLILYLEASGAISLGLYNGDSNSRDSATGSDAVYLWIYGPL